MPADHVHFNGSVNLADAGSVMQEIAWLALQVRVLNAVTAAARRPVSFVSFTVPQHQREDSYFAPLAELTAGPDTELNFALVPYHPAEQAPGTTGDQIRLIDAALEAGPRGSTCIARPSPLDSYRCLTAAVATGGRRCRRRAGAPAVPECPASLTRPAIPVRKPGSGPTPARKPSMEHDIAVRPHLEAPRVGGDRGDLGTVQPPGAGERQARGRAAGVAAPAVPPGQLSGPDQHDVTTPNEHVRGAD
jgi:hypothetical protein